MLEAVAAFLSTLKQASPSLLLGIAIASGVILFAPDSFLTLLGLEVFLHSNKPYIGGTSVVAIALLLSHSIFRLAAFGKGVLTARQVKKKAAEAEANRHKKLHDLTPDEKAYLVPYVVDDENTQYFLIEDGVAGGLVAKGVLYRSSHIGSLVDGWAFNMQPWAKSYLKSHPELLEGFNPTPQGPPKW